jgi:hypothetical protein
VGGSGGAMSTAFRPMCACLESGTCLERESSDGREEEDHVSGLIVVVSAVPSSNVGLARALLSPPFFFAFLCNATQRRKQSALDSVSPTRPTLCEDGERAILRRCVTAGR